MWIHGLSHNCIRTALLTGFTGLLQKSQLTNSDAVSLRSSFVFYPWGMMVSIKRLKIVQFSERELLIPIAAVNSSDLCAVYWARKHFSKTKVRGDAPVFQVPAPGTIYRENNQWIYYFIPLDACCEESIMQGGYNSMEDFHCNTFCSVLSAGLHVLPLAEAICRAASPFE